MSILDNLYSGTNGPCNAICSGCTVLSQSKPEYAYTDYEEINEADVLFLSDSFKYHAGSMVPFSPQETSLIYESLPGDVIKVEESAAIKCPSVRDGDMTTADMHICRTHLDKTVDAVKPKLIFTCGNLAMKMLLKKSGIMNKRGTAFTYKSESGYECVVVPIYHPYAIIKEPRHKFLFQIDIKNAYKKYVLGERKNSDLKYTVLTTLDEVAALATYLSTTSDVMSVDVETTGLNFLTDKIMSVSFSTNKGTWVIPVDHKDSPFLNDPGLWVYLEVILRNPNNRKVFHNGKFDVKFFLTYGVAPLHIWDTKIMHHILNENAPKSLMDLVKLYFASELEDL